MEKKELFSKLLTDVRGIVEGNTTRDEKILGRWRNQVTAAA